ncbi:TerB N-terminal domain-containing protein [Saccharibacillus alkalitolerans]|uniref:TerB N-terminal domain-containing protein n=1 Tax=Saccharibacillus alkalitolerans TaxID=2705290 RepID=A0ABX0FDX9_9BACL|nr:TerB N-terminal domain-containing protein [Saccharibacillus alkalitolerans]NGZ77951.1 hypothetical protein [Saccharibacillus alkalitolerans]
MSDFFARSAPYSYHLYLSADGGGKFWLSATDGEGPVLLRDALTPLPRYMLPEYRLNREETPIRASRVLVVRDTLLKAIGRGDAPGLHLHMGDEVELAMMAEADDSRGLTFFLDGERSSLIGRLPEGALYLEPGWLGRFVDAGYELIDMPGFEEDDLDWIGRRIETDEWEELLVRAIPAMRGRGLPVSSAIEYSPEPAGRLEITDCGEEHATIRVSGGADVLRLAGLHGYVLEASGTDGIGALGGAESDPAGEQAEGGAWAGEADPGVPRAAETGLPAEPVLEALPEASEPGGSERYFMRPSMETETVRRLFGSESGGTARGTELAEFARLAEREWGPLVTGEAAAKFRDLHRLYDAADWSWSLRGGPVMARGVGVVRAEPVLSAGGRRFTAAELTDAWTTGRRYLRLEDGWIDLEAPEFARSLREHGAGGGSAGLISAGFSYRQRIGLPGENAAGELPLALEGPKPAEAGEERPALAHLRYLAGWGMNGGLHGGAGRWLAELGAFAAETLAAFPDCRLVAAGRRELLAELAEAAGRAGAVMPGAEEASSFGGPDSGSVRTDAREPLGGSEAEAAESAGGGRHSAAGGSLGSESAGDAIARLQRWADEGEESSGSDGGRSIPLPPRGARPDAGGAWADASGGADSAESGAAAKAVGPLGGGGLILVPSSLLQRADFEEKLRADILLLLEPDTFVRSDETRPFARLDSAEARVRISVYSDEGHMNDARVRAVQIRLLKLYDSLTRGFLLFDPDKGTPTLGARPPLRGVPDFKLPSWRKEAGGMAEMFVDEPRVLPEAPTRKGLAIPPRQAGGIAGSGQEPDPRDTRTSRPEPERSPSLPLAGRRPPARGGAEARPVRPVQQQSAEREFVRRARENADRTESEVPFVPFSSYWPTYAAMKPEQEQWYFYWRSEFRRGEKVETDLSYLFIYIYELINGIGWEQPQDGMEAMIRVWESYRARFRRLDGYMADWVREFALVHALDLPESPALEQTSGQLKGELLDLELARRFGETPAGLTWELIARLSDYDMTESRFYKEAGKKTMPRVLPHIVRAVDEHLVRTRGIRLTGLFREADIRITERYLFRSAVYDPELYGRTYLVRAPKLGLHAQLRDFMTQLVRQTENELRARFKFGGRLRGIKLDPEIAGVIAEAAEREFLPPEQRTAPEPPKRPEVRLDPEELEKLRRDSDEVLRMLTGELMTGERAKDGSPADGSGEKPAAASSGEGANAAGPSSRPERRSAEEEASAGETANGTSSGRDDEAAYASETAGGAAEDAREAAEYDGFEMLELPEDGGGMWPAEPVPGALSFDPEEAPAKPAEMPKALRSKERADDGAGERAAAAGSPGSKELRGADDESSPFPDGSAEGTNGAAFGEAGTSGAPDDGLRVAGAPSSPPDAGVPSSLPDAGGWDVSALDGDWQAFAALLGPAERDMVRAVLLGSGDAERMGIAGASGELPETMIDRINEAAMETIGDLLIDGGEVLEEYVPNLEGLRGR